MGACTEVMEFSPQDLSVTVLVLPLKVFDIEAGLQVWVLWEGVHLQSLLTCIEAASSFHFLFCKQSFTTAEFVINGFYGIIYWV